MNTTRNNSKINTVPNDEILESKCLTSSSVLMLRISSLNLRQGKGVKSCVYVLMKEGGREGGGCEGVSECVQVLVLTTGSHCLYIRNCLCALIIEGSLLLASKIRIPILFQLLTCQLVVPQMRVNRVPEEEGRKDVTN